MKIGVLGGSGGMAIGRLLTSFRINADTILDAGSVAQALPIDEQVRIHNIILTHAHLDHSGTLPFFVDNVFGLRAEPFVVHSIPESIQSVRDHLFNNNIWPDFTMLPDFKRASMRFNELADETPMQVGELTVTAIRVNHTIPAVGYMIEDADSAVLFSGDTAETERIWEIAAANPKLRAAFVETSFPNGMQNIADISGHLTPQTLAAELKKLGRDVPIYIYHIKPRVFNQVRDEIIALGDSRLIVVEQGVEYDCS